MEKTTRATMILNQVAAGDEAAASRLLPLVYDELRALADKYFRGQPAHHTLEPTALVHEAFIKLIDQRPRNPGNPRNPRNLREWKSRAHFVAVAATAMRQILVDHARARAMAKRGADWRRIPLTESVGGGQADLAAAPGGDLLALHDALTALASLDQRQSRVVELRFFGGLTAQETAEALGVSKTTVDNDWRAARAWLNTRLRDGAPR